MSSTVGPRYVTGTIVATGAALAVRKVGGKPRKVCIFNQDNSYRAEWNEELPEGYAYVYDADGTVSIVTTAGISLLDGGATDPPGFEIGALANINDTTTETLKYEAWI